MNLVIISGRTTKDPEIRNAGQTAVANYSVAVDRRFKRDGEPTADFFNCVAFGKSAEFAEKYIKKGTKLIISGHLQNDSYTNKDGNKVTATKVIVDTQEFAESKNNSSSAQESTPALGDGFNNEAVGDDELPFD